MSSQYARMIQRLAPDHDPAHIEAWMRLEHSTLDGLGPRFVREVATAVACVEAAGVAESDQLARSFGLAPRYGVGVRVLVSQEGGLPPAEAEITGENEHRPHLVKVKYSGGRGAGGWIARLRITARVVGDDPPGETNDS